jgi:hypothetical protein
MFESYWLVELGLSYLFMLWCCLYAYYACDTPILSVCASVLPKCLLVALLLTVDSISDTCDASGALLCYVYDLFDPFGSMHASGALLCLVYDIIDPFDQQMLVARLQV